MTLTQTGLTRRLVTAEDADEIYGIYMHEQVIPFLTYDPMSRHDFQPIFDALLAQGNFFAYPWEGRIGGIYRISHYPGRVRHVACLGTVAVNPAFQRRGIGRRMLEEAIACLREQGVRRVELYAEADNPGGLAFYRQLGFEQEGLLRGFYRRAHENHDVDEYVMGLLL
jgi:putative acetyltransferase